MTSPVVGDDAKLAELKALVDAIRDRVRSQYPSTSVSIDPDGPAPIHVPLADLMPIVHARDAAQAKMASIGSVNPRAGGIVNNLIQAVKRLVARSLNWLVRDQIVFNRGALACVEASVESLNDLNRALASLASQIEGRLQEERNANAVRFKEADLRIQELSGIAGALGSQWNQAQREWAAKEKAWRERDRVREEALASVHRQFEARALAQERSFADLVKAQHGEFSQMSRAQHAEFTESLRKAGDALQEQLRSSARELEKVIHSELRVMRQRAVTAPTTVALPAAAEPMDYQAFSERFRGSEVHIRESQRFYADKFQGEVLDIGCGHGEFLDVMRERGVSARGIDLSAESVAYCKSKGLAVEQANLFDYLASLPDRSLDGIFSSQVVEHLSGNQIPTLIQLCAAKLREGGLLAIETPNPACLAIFATHFYLDPTHVRPVPAALLDFYLRENGFGGIEVVERSPAADSFPELQALPEGVRNRFFGGLDYAIFAHKL